MTNIQLPQDGLLPHLSHSRMQKYITCPEQYRLHYLEGGQCHLHDLRKRYRRWSAGLCGLDKGCYLGGMAFVLSCALSNRIAAVGLVASAQTLPFSWCGNSTPVPVIAFHGTDDPVTHG